MQFPESWLRSFCNPDLNTQQLADLLTMAGLEVEELQPVAPPFTGVVVAQVLEVAKHDAISGVTQLKRIGSKISFCGHFFNDDWFPTQL